MLKPLTDLVAVNHGGESRKDYIQRLSLVENGLSSGGNTLLYSSGNY